MCFSQWRGKESIDEMHPDFEMVLTNYQKHYGEGEGAKKFSDWIEKYGLDPLKPYSNQAQLFECLGGICEAFRWTEPLIQLYKADGDAKYYKTKALTANMSMNRRDYSDVKHLKAAAPTLTWRPLNLNHDHAKFLAFPEARVDWAVFEDNAVECVIRIPNEMGTVQKAIENGDIMHVSIEGEPRGGTGKSPEMYNFTALALLEKNMTLPGDPLTYLEPLFLKESLGRSLVESLRMEGIENVKEMSETNSKRIEEIKKLTESMTIDEVKTKIITLSKELDTSYKATDAPTKSDEEYQKRDLLRIERDAWIEVFKNMIQSKAYATESLPKLIKELYGMDVCGQCKHFQDLSDKTVKIEHSTGGDSVSITRTEGAVGPGVGRCAVTEKLARKQDAACTDGRPRDSPTGLDRTMEDVKYLAEKSELLREVAFGRTLLKESADREAIEREGKIRAMQEGVSKDQTLIKQQREIAELTSISAKTKEELENQRKISDALKEQNVRFKIGMDNADRDIKLYKDQNDRYERSVQKLNDEVVQVKEELTKSMIRANDETAKRAESVQRTINADNERSRIQTECALLMQQLSEKTAEISDYAKRLSDGASRELKLQREVQETRENKTKLVDEIRDMKQKLSKTPKEIQITI